MIKVSGPAYPLYFAAGGEPANSRRKQQTAIDHISSFCELAITLDGSQDGPFCALCHTDDLDIRLALREVVNQWLRCPKGHSTGVGNREIHYAVPKKLPVTCLEDR